MTCKEDDLTTLNYLYHGTCLPDENLKYITNIDLSKSNLHTDFGKGFYLTPDIKKASKRAIGLKNKNAQGKALVIKYPFEYKSNDKCKIFSDMNVEWTKFIVGNRLFNNDDESFFDFLENNQNQKYQLVYGYIADKRTQRIVQKTSNFMKNEFNKNKKEFSKKRITFQDFLESNNFFENICEGIIEIKKGKLSKQISIHYSPESIQILDGEVNYV